MNRVAQSPPERFPEAAGLIQLQPDQGPVGLGPDPGVFQEGACLCFVEFEVHGVAVVADQAGHAPHRPKRSLPSPDESPFQGRTQRAFDGLCLPGLTGIEWRLHARESNLDLLSFTTDEDFTGLELHRCLNGPEHPEGRIRLEEPRSFEGGLPEIHGESPAGLNPAAHPL